MSPVFVPYFTEGGCVIVTAAYGSRFAPEVAWIKHLRDKYKRCSPIYHRIVTGLERVYYSFSPTVARCMWQNSYLRKSIRFLFVVPIYKTLRFFQAMLSRILKL
jgi:hypothetical protein